MMNVVSIEGQGVRDRVVGIVGREHASALGESLSAAPADAREASELLAFANEHGLAVCIEGSGSKLGWMEPGRSDLRVRTQRMASVLEHTWQDMTCTVEAGCSWGTMQAALAEHGQQVALDPLWPERVTVGGVVGANDSGALRLRYGGLRDVVIGMTVVLADGTVARSGGKVVKNVAGYDLPKLLCGSFGTLALVTEVTFRLHSIARSTATITVRDGSAEALRRLLLRLLNSHYSIQSMQMRTDEGGFALDVRLAALPMVLEAQKDGLVEVAASMGLVAETATDEVWAARERMFSGGGATFKGTMIPTQIAAAVQAVRDLGGGAVVQATGIMTGSLGAGESAGRLSGLRAQMEAAGGSLTLLGGSAEAGFDRWGRLPDSMAVMRAVKRQFDPKGVLNAGRFLGGI